MPDPLKAMVDIMKWTTRENKTFSLQHILQSAKKSHTIVID